MVRLEDATWWTHDLEASVNAATPGELEDEVDALHGDLRSGRLAIEFLDVEIADAVAIGDWLRLFGARYDTTTLVERLLEPRTGEMTSDFVGEGLHGFAVRVPFVRLSRAHAGAVLVARTLLLVVTERAVARLWRPALIVGTTAPAFDATSIGHGGRDLSTELEPGEHPLPSQGWRQPNVPPVNAVLDETRAGAGSVEQASQAIEEEALIWHQDFYAGSGLAGDATDAERRRLATLGESVHVLVRARRDATHLLHELQLRLRAEGTYLPTAPLVGLDTPEFTVPLARAENDLASAAANLVAARSDLRDAADLLASTAATAQLRVQHEAVERGAAFERRVSILAGVITGPAVIAGLAGANVDFWPLPAHGGQLARGSLLVVAGLAVLVGWLTWRWLRPK